MGNCSLRAVTDSAQGVNAERAIRMKSSEVKSSTAATGETSMAVLPAQGNGVWKVKLVIDPKDLEWILSEDVNTEALIEQIRIAVKSTPARGKSS